ncbi:MAG: class I SAM-dependent methyltransferase [Bacteroidetes bacterium]|nr:MAG: class I SAM-dependent methyltransferase [Bacteroidota bacterium]
MKKPNWRLNLGRKGGFWQNGYWYDLHLERRMPLAIPMLEELLIALPPLEDDTLVCDLACGTGNGSFTVLSAYPTSEVVLIDRDTKMLDIARAKLNELQVDPETIEATISTDGNPLPGGPYDVVVATLSLHELVGENLSVAEAEGRFELLFQSIRASLTPGGHVIIGDHVGSLSLYRQLKAMERAGFVDVDCAWRQDDFFVAGGQAPG